jgi:hypothetical protein
VLRILGQEVKLRAHVVEEEVELEGRKQEIELEEEIGKITTVTLLHSLHL